MSGLPWFRMYAEAVDDDKLRLLAFEDRWHFVAVLCCKCSGVLDSDSQTLDRRMAIKLGLGAAECDEVKRRLREVGLIDEHWQPRNWGSRQFESDHSGAERSRRWRRKTKRHRNVSETSPQRSSDTPDTEQIQNRTDTDKKGRRRATRVPEDFSPDLAYAKAQLPDVDAEAEARKFRDWEFKTPRSDWVAAWRTWISNAKERGQYAKVARRWV